MEYTICRNGENISLEYRELMDIYHMVENYIYTEDITSMIDNSEDDYPYTEKDIEEIVDMYYHYMIDYSCWSENAQLAIDDWHWERKRKTDN